MALGVDENDTDGVWDAVPVPLCDGVCDGVGVRVGVTDAVPVPLCVGV